ncbi:unnamed protein product [Orchesella dallaii]|uniref:Kazal-like domain-containing protein n=1 Tax=Orchesella dallaii TaxID=48710 RepID=A0ABP1RSI1_9HEXA
MPQQISETNFRHRTSSLVLLILLSSQLCFSITTTTKRQAPGTLAGDLLPPPALSKSFPTLKPRPNSPPPQRNSNSPSNPVISPPSRDLLPPGRPAGAPSPPRPSPAAAPTTNDIPLLPPIEIPPEKPLTDSEILSLKETSFIPTTGQGAGNSNNGGSSQRPQVSLQSGGTPPPSFSPVAQPTPNSLESQRNNVISTSSSSNVRFPTESSGSAPVQPVTNCPSCECTSEVDYICASNRVLYLNSCSFDCATVCDADLKKIPLEFCVSQNQQ